MNNENNLLKLEVSLDKIFFPKFVNRIPSGEFGIFTAKVLRELENTIYKDKDNRIKLKGPCPLIEYGPTYKVWCRLADQHAVYGDTYEIIYMSRLVEISDKESQKEFMRTIVSENVVEELFNTYDDVIKILNDKDVEKLCKVKGIKAKTAMRILNTYEDCKDYSTAYIELGQLGLTPNFIRSIVDYFRSPEVAIDKIRNDPYSLVEVDGIGFKKADDIAQRVGIEQFDTRRVKGFMLHHLQEQAEAGFSYLYYQQLMSALYETLGFVPENIISESARQLMYFDKLYVSPDGMKVALKQYYKLEEQILEELKRLQIGRVEIVEGEEETDDSLINELLTEYLPYDFEPMQFNITNPDETIKRVEFEQGFEFTEEQINAIKISIDNNVIAITGLGGTGKSSTAKGICNLYKNASIAACALSGKAALRITEATGFPAATIHRTLGYINGKFEFDRYNKMPCDILLIDEATMINGHLFLSLLEAVPSGAKVIMLGDINQLTPIGNCQVFGDILAANAFPTVRLTKPHRQALRSGIIPTSISVATQQQIFDSTFEGNTIVGELQDMELDITTESKDLLPKVVEKFQEQMKKYNDVLEVQICVPMKSRGTISCYSINKAIQDIYNPITNFTLEQNIITNVLSGKGDDVKKYEIRVNDKVINRKNNYKALDIDGHTVPVFNGNIGIVKEINENHAVIDFQGIGEIIIDDKNYKNLELAYACTVHSLQGSGFVSTIVALDNSSYIMNNCELLYTAITRAKKYCVLIANNYAVKKSIETKEVRNKQTFLKEMLLNSKKDFEHESNNEINEIGE